MTSPNDRPGKIRQHMKATILRLFNTHFVGRTLADDWIFSQAFFFLGACILLVGAWKGSSFLFVFGLLYLIKGIIRCYRYFQLEPSERAELARNENRASTPQGRESQKGIS